MKPTTRNPLFTAHPLKLMQCFPIRVQIGNADFELVADSALKESQSSCDGWGDWENGGAGGERGCNAIPATSLMAAIPGNSSAPLDK